MEQTNNRYESILRGSEATVTMSLIVDTVNSQKPFPEGVFVDSDYVHPDRSTQPIEIEVDEEFQLPLNMIVGADGFNSWDGRPPHILKDKRPSKQVIEDYASRDTAIPPIDDLRLYLAPEGRMFGVTANSHRVAAAKLRGQDTIGFKGYARIRPVHELPWPLQEST